MALQEFSIFLAQAYGWVGLPATVVATAVWQYARILESRPDPTKDLTEALVHHRLVETQPNAILNLFHNAPTGPLNMYYQLFWPVFIQRNEMESVNELRKLCETRQKEDFSKWHRVRSLPAVAAVHAIGSGSSNNVEELTDLIASTLHGGLDAENDPNREVLEIIWQNMTAALIKNTRSFEHFRVGELSCSRCLAISADI